MKVLRGQIGVWSDEKQKFIYYDKEKVKDAMIKRRNNPVAPSIKVDTMDYMKHPMTGQWTDSKSTFDAISKATGCVPWEEPDDWEGNGVYRELNELELKEIEEDIDQAAKRAYYDLRDGNMKLSDEQQKYAKEVNEVIEAKTGKTSKLIGGIE